MHKLLVALLLTTATMANAQEVNITKVDIKGEQIELTYNLIDERIDRSYALNLYTSKDNFIQPMEQVSGDVGVDIPVGNNKKLIWEAEKELGDDFAGEISFEIKGNYYVPFINIEGITEGREFKRGKKYDIAWTGGRGDNVLKFELYKGENLINSFEERPNTGETSLAFPVRVKPGPGYTLKVSDVNNRDEVVFTEEFMIRRKIPFYAQIAGAAIIGAGIYILIDALTPEPEFQVPDAPLPPQNN